MWNKRIYVKDPHKNINIKINDGNYAIERKSIDIKICGKNKSMTFIESKIWWVQTIWLDCRIFFFASFILSCIVDNCFFCVLEVHYANMRAESVKRWMHFTYHLGPKVFAVHVQQPLNSTPTARGREEKRNSPFYFFCLFINNKEIHFVYICKTNKC